MKAKELNPGDRVRLVQNIVHLNSGHEKYAGCIVTVEFTTGVEKVQIREFRENHEMLYWLPAHLIKEKIPFQLPEELFEI